MMVTIPEPSVQQWIYEVLKPAEADPEPHATMRHATRWFREHIRPIPSDRVLKEGERAVDSRRFDRMLSEESERPHLLEVEQYVRTMAHLERWSDDTMDYGPLRSLDALRSQRAVEGGAG